MKNDFRSHFSRQFPPQEKKKWQLLFKSFKDKLKIAAEKVKGGKRNSIILPSSNEK